MNILAQDSIKDSKDTLHTQNKLESGVVKTIESIKDRAAYLLNMLEDMKELKEDKIIIDNILNNKKAIKRLAPICHYKNIQLNKKFFDKALNKILKADSKLSKKEKSDLFRQTLEYYSLPQNISVPIYHSTSSYTLRKALEEGFEGGHGASNGEHKTRLEDNEKHGWEVQKGLSVSVSINPDKNRPSDKEGIEYFQQLYARTNCKKGELDKFLSINSSNFQTKLTLEAAMELLSFEITDFQERIRNDIAYRKKIKPEEVSDEIIEEITKKYIEEFEVTRDYGPDPKHPDSIAYLDQLKNKGFTDLLEEIRTEQESYFPCFITFEAKTLANEKNLEVLFEFNKNGKSPNVTSVPFEDRFYGKLMPEYIKEIRVPYSQIPKVKLWLQKKNLQGISVIPLELFEIKRIIENEAEKSIIN